MKSTSSVLDSHNTFLRWLTGQGVTRTDLKSDSALARLIAGPADHSARCRPSEATAYRHTRVLILLCQKIGSTGSGIVVKEIVDRAGAAGAEYAVLCGGYDSDDPSRLFSNQPSYLKQVLFKSDPPNGLPFPIVGMSNRMPYESRAFKDLTFTELNIYLDVWSHRIGLAVETFQPDVIHVHHLWLLAPLAASVASDLPIVISIHGTDLHRAKDAPHLKSLIIPWIVRFNKILALTDESVSLTRSQYSIEKDAFAVFGNGFNEDLFHPGREVQPDILDRYGIPCLKGRRVILFVGKYERWKGIEWLIRAFARLVQDKTPDIILMIAGTGPSDECRRYLDLAAALGIERHVVLTGAVEYQHVGMLMNLASVFVLPAYHEPFGLVVLEALACGCRVVATDQGGPSRFIPQELRDRGDASLTPGLPSLDPGEATAKRFVDNLARAIAEQIVRPLRFEDRSEISALVRHLTWDAYVRRLGEVYRRL